MRQMQLFLYYFYKDYVNILETFLTHFLIFFEIYRKFLFHIGQIYSQFQLNFLSDYQFYDQYLNALRNI